MQSAVEINPKVMSLFDRFSELGQDSRLPYVAECLAGLRDGTARFVSDPEGVRPVAAKDLLRIYERRVTSLSSFATDHAKAMRVDAENVCAALRTRHGSLWSLWLVACDPCFIFSFFHAVDDARFFGAIKAVDDRKVSPADRVALWGA